MMDTAPSGNVYSGGQDKDEDKYCDNFSSASTLHKNSGFPGRPRLARSACIDKNWPIIEYFSGTYVVVSLAYSM